MEWPIHITYWNGSRSYFSDTYYKLLEISRPIKFEDLSLELRIQMSVGWRGEEEDARKYYDDVLRVCSFADLRSICPNGEHEHHGLYHKDKIVCFRTHETEDLFEEDITPEKYAELPEEARKVYQYFEWDDPMSWRAHIPEIVRKVSQRVNEFEDMNFLDCDDVRVIFYQSC